MRDLKLKYKFWLLNGVAFFLVCVVVLFSMRQIQLAQREPDFWLIFFDTAPAYAGVVFVLMLMQLACSQLLITFVERYVTNLRNVMVHVREQGDLTARVTVGSNDEVGQMAAAFNAMQETYQQMLKSMLEIALGLNAAAAELTKVAQKTEWVMSSQQRETHVIVSAMSQMTEVSAEVARNAVSMQEQSDAAVAKAASGNSAVQASRDSIRLLSAEINEAAALVEQLKADALRIDSTTNEIKAISEQTNLLALNAAIEAARAGESGRGFAVVADEVRSLAQHAHDSSEKIQEVVAAIRGATGNIERVMKQGVQSANEGEQVSLKVVDLFVEIKQQIDTIKSSNMMVAAAAEEQSQTTLTVNQNLQTIEQGSNAARESAGDVALSAQAIHELAFSLESMVKKMRIG